MKKGDIVLVSFPFTDLTGNKKRPALVLIDAELDATVAFISTQTHWREPTDVLLSATPDNGLKKESLLRLSKIATLDKDLILGRLGVLDNRTIKQVNKNLKILLKLD